LGALLAELERVQEENERLKAAGSDGGFVLGEVEEDEGWRRAATSHTI
jgi:hypothetical protein